MFEPRVTNPTRTVTYTVLNNDLNTVTVNDGLKIEAYTLTNDKVRGYTAVKNTQDLSGDKILESVNTAYYYTQNAQSNYVARIETVATQFAKTDGTLSSASVHTYNYDNWGNTTYIQDPNGTITYMAYGNTNNNGSNLNLSQINSLYQDAQFASAFPVPFYEYDQCSADYFYTTDTFGPPIDKSNPVPWSYNGISCYVFNTQQPGTVPLYEYDYYNLYYYYTTNTFGPPIVMPYQMTWSYKGISCYVFNTQQPGTVPLYEYNYYYYYKLWYYYTTNPQDYILHIFTFNPWIYEGISGYVYPHPIPNRYDLMLTKATLITDPVHNTTQLNQTHYQYDTLGNLLKKRRAVYNNSNTSYLDTTYTYDAYGNRTSKTDPLSNSILFTYNTGLTGINDGSYLIQVASKDSSGNNVALATYSNFNEFGKPTTVTDPNGNVFTYGYDAVGRTTKQAVASNDPNAAVSKVIAYDDTNSLATIFYGNATKGWQSGRINYDPLFGKPVKLQRLPSLLNVASYNTSDLLSALGSSPAWQITKTMTYDTHGRKVTECDGIGNTTSYNYDSLDRVVQTTYPDGTIATVSWNGLNLTKYDANGNRQDEFYDLLYRLTSIQEYPDPTNLSNTYATTYVYDSASHPVQMTNPNNAATQNTYDNLGRLVRMDFPQDGSNPLTAETYSYDNAGNLLTKTNAKGTQTMAYQFLGDYRLQQVTEPDGSIVGYTYDNNNNLLIQTSAGANYTYSNYDAQNRAHNLTAQMDGNNFSFSYNYDPFGHVTNIVYPGLSTPVQYDYDALDRLLDIPQFVTSCSYDADNRPTGMVYANGINNTWSYTYDRLTALGIGSLLNFNYTYDAVGNITRFRPRPTGKLATITIATTG